MNKKRWAEAEKNLIKIMDSGFKKETVSQYSEFINSVRVDIDKMNACCTSPETQLKKQISL